MYFREIAFVYECTFLSIYYNLKCQNPFHSSGIQRGYSPGICCRIYLQMLFIKVIRRQNIIYYILRFLWSKLSSWKNSQTCSQSKFFNISQCRKSYTPPVEADWKIIVESGHNLIGLFFIDVAMKVVPQKVAEIADGPLLMSIWGAAGFGIDKPAFIGVQRCFTSRYLASCWLCL